VEDLNVLKIHGPLLENHLISVTSFQTQITCLFHEICYVKIQITVKKIAWNKNMYFYLFMSLSSVYNHSAEE
jgi:hypothetical protein